MQLIFNKTSGGGNKVKINGLPPNERLNLKETYNGIFQKGIGFDDISNMICLFEENGVYYYANMGKVYKLENNIFTQIGTKLYNGLNRAIIKKDDSIILMSDGYNELMISKLENGTFTKLGNSNGLSYNSHTPFFIEETAYFLSGSKEKIYKSTDFGKNWTDITRQISFKNGLTIQQLEFFYSRPVFNKDNCKYLLDLKNQIRLKFDGQTFEKINCNFTCEQDSPYLISVTNGADNRNKKNRNLILSRERTSSSNTEFKCTLFEINVLENEIKLIPLKNMFSIYEFNQNAICIDETNEISFGFSYTSRCWYVIALFLKMYMQE